MSTAYVSLASLLKRTHSVRQLSALPTLDSPHPPILSTSTTPKLTKALLSAGMVGAGGVEPPSSSVSDPTSLDRAVRRTVTDRGGSMESPTREAVSEPESSHDLSRFLSACVDPHDGRLWPGTSVRPRSTQARRTQFASPAKVVVYIWSRPARPSAPSPAATGRRHGDPRSTPTPRAGTDRGAAWCCRGWDPLGGLR